MPKVNEKNGAQGSSMNSQPLTGVEKGKKAAAELAAVVQKKRGFKARGLMRNRKNETTATTRPAAVPAETALPPVEDLPPPPPVTIEGIKIAAGESPVTADATSAPATVSIVQDASDEELKRLVLERTRGPLPVILRSTKMPELTPENIDTFLEVPQFEKQVLSEAIIGGLGKVKTSGAPTDVKAAEEESRKSLKSIDDRVEALAYMLDTMDTAASGLNISKISGQIMQRASDSLAAVVAPTEAGNDPLPATLDGYVSLVYPRVNVDASLTNTGRLALIAQDTFLACLTTHPTTLTNLSRPPIHAESLFSAPGAYQYDPDGRGSRPETDIPTVNQMFARNEKSILKSPDNIVAGATLRKNPGFMTLDPNAASTASTQEEMWDDIVHSICMLSNEMIMSAGIGRLQGSKLGNRFLERRTDRPQQYDPFIKALGFSPRSTSKAVSKFITTGPDRPGSYFDYLALGEEVANREIVVMPFEVNTVVYEETPYVAGRQYFVEMATQLERPELRGSLRRFSTRYSEAMKDISAYLTELMALDVTTPLAPELLLARILQDFKQVIAAMADGVSDAEKPGIFVAALFAFMGFGDKTQVGAKKSGNVTGPVFIADVLKMSVIRSLRLLDSTLTDSAFILSRQATTYTTVPGEYNPELTIKSAVENLGQFYGIDTSQLGSSSRRVVLSSTATNLIDSTARKYERFSYFAGGSVTSRPNLFLEGAPEINLITLAAQTIREIQKEALNLAQRGGAASDYRNSTGGTLMSDCDDDRLVDVITTIYTNLAYLLLPVAIFDDNNIGSVGVLCDIDSARLGATVIEDIINSLVNGTRISADDIQSRRDVDPSTYINISPLGDNTAKTTPADLADCATRTTRHRYYVKAGLKILEATSSGVTASSTKASRLLDVISGGIAAKDLKGSEAVLYDMFVTNAEVNRPLLRNVSPHQVNLCALGRSLYGDPGAVEMRKDIATTSSERLALRDFMKSVYERNVNGLQVLSVGVPSGLLESLYNPALEVGDGQETIVAARGTETDDRKRHVRVEIDRFDNVYFNSVSTVTTNIFGTSPSETEFDPEIFIVPGDIAYDPAAWPAGSTTVMDAILRSTTFSRIRRGRFVEKVTGDNIPTSEIGLYFNALRSYLLDLFLYDAIGTRHLEGAPPAGPPQLSPAGYTLMQVASQSEKMSRSLLCKTGFINVFNASTRRVKTGEEMRSLLTPTTPYEPPQFSRSDVTFASLAACASTVSDPTSIITFRPYERVFHFLYDESVIRNQVTGDTLDIKSRRRQFDIYTISARISYGGGTSGS